MSQGYYEPDEARELYWQDAEMICGFGVIRIPQKPDYLPLTQEEFQQEVISAWTRGGHMEKTAAVFHGGEREWAALYNDKDIAVRGAVACRASEEYQMKLVGDPASVIRQYLAIYSTDRVRTALLERGETDRYVLENIAKFGNTEIRRRLLPVIWDKKDSLYDCIPYLPQSCLEKLMAHPNLDIRYKAALHGSRDLCIRGLYMACSRHNTMDLFVRPLLRKRMEMLNQVGMAININCEKIRKNENMELSV